MTFITYVFLGLCLPMVAMCAGDIECCFAGDFVVGLVTEPTPFVPEITKRSIYVNVDEKWTLEISEAGYTSYDFRTNTRTTYDEYVNPHCQKDEIPENDVIYRYLCIDKGAVQSSGPVGSIQYQVSLGASSSIVYTATPKSPEDVCIPREAETRSSDPTVAKVIASYMVPDPSGGLYLSKRNIRNKLGYFCRFNSGFSLDL